MQEQGFEQCLKKFTEEVKTGERCDSLEKYEKRYEEIFEDEIIDEDDLATTVLSNYPALKPALVVLMDALIENYHSGDTAAWSDGYLPGHKIAINLAMESKEDIPVLTGYLQLCNIGNESESNDLIDDIVECVLNTWNEYSADVLTMICTYALRLEEGGDIIGYYPYEGGVFDEESSTDLFLAQLRESVLGLSKARSEWALSRIVPGGNDFSFEAQEKVAAIFKHLYYNEDVETEEASEAAAILFLNSLAGDKVLEKADFVG